MKTAGKVVCRELKYLVSKGKDSEPVHFATVKVEGRDGLPSGKYSFAMTDEEVENREYGLGEVCVVDVSQPQTQLNLNDRATARRTVAAKH